MIEREEVISCWGNYPKVLAKIYDAVRPETVFNAIKEKENIIALGNGRSYGDSALNERLLDMRTHNYFLNFDEERGVLHCQSGVLLSDILDVFVPKGWFLSVTPGTKYVSVGGAIASDIHGKNHHVAGTFSNCVLSFRLLLPNGTVVKCTKQNNPELFKNTCGGMGLTGVILDTSIQLVRINSINIDQITIKTANLKETFDAFERYKDTTYSVAWIDCLAKGEDIGKCILRVGEHSDDGDLNYKQKRKVTIPFELPSFTLNKLSVTAFNKLYYAKEKKGMSEQKVSFDSFFYPLDALNHWNRIYGRHGFTQYQFVLPLENSYDGLQEILAKIAASGKGSFLAVLKLFGEANGNYLSFPIKGYTLALDFKIEKGLMALLDELDKIVVKYGGRIYLTKDVRVSRSVFEQGYPEVEKFRAFRKEYGMDKVFNSLQSLRLGI